jgi:CRP-like cAMP-binding protein
MAASGLDGLTRGRDFIQIWLARGRRSEKSRQEGGIPSLAKMVQAPEQDAIANRILRALAPATLNGLRPALESVSLQRGKVIDRVDRRVEHLHFVNRGLVSLVKSMRDGRTVEIGAIGIEGVTGAAALFGLERAALDSVVQIEGTVFRIRREVLRQQMERDETLRHLLERYARFTITQIAQTAACNRLHYLEERLCRWLLIAHDNALADTFPLTQEFIAMMLGVQRSGISIAANVLRNSGMIQYRRGRVTIVNRAALEDAACECYAATRDELEKLFRSR